MKALSVLLELRRTHFDISTFCLGREDYGSGELYNITALPSLDTKVLTRAGFVRETRLIYNQI